jgi:hypothetical protein
MTLSCEWMTSLVVFSISRYRMNVSAVAHVSQYTDGWVTVDLSHLPAMKPAPTVKIGLGRTKKTKKNQSGS